MSEGLFAWLVGIGVPVGFAIWIAAHTTRTSRSKPGEKGLATTEEGTTA